MTWGDNHTSQYVSQPTGNDFVKIACGYNHNVGLRKNGTVVTWGDNSYSQCTNQPTDSDFVKIACGSYHSIGLRACGTVVLWGNIDGKHYEGRSISLQFFNYTPEKLNLLKFLYQEQLCLI
jgi:alpha-tubulin suppressor-like RCC1 family protein